MSRQLSGTAAIHSVDGTVTFSGLVAGANLLQGHNVTDSFDISKLQNGEGDIVGKAATGRELKATVDVIIIDSSDPQTLAAAKTNTVLPLSALMTVTIASTGIAFLDGAWNFEGATYDGKIGDYHKMTLTLSQTKVSGVFGILTPI